MQYKKDYWGFVYLWRDRASGMYCLGSHFGSVGDGYTTRTGLMRSAYKKRPSHFMRRIVYWLRSSDHEGLLKEEDRWLSMISDKELSLVENHNAGTARYYNCKKYAMGGAWNKGRSGVQRYVKRNCQHCGRSFNPGMLAAWHGDRCLSNPKITAVDLASRRVRFRNPKKVPYAREHLAKANMPRQCSVCGMITLHGNIVRWHEEKCRPRRERNDILARRPVAQLTAEWAG